MRVDARWPAGNAGERGVGLMEVVVSLVLATLAVIALAWSFGAARGLVNNYEAARIALAAAQRRMELLAALPPGSDSLRVSRAFGPFAVTMDGRPLLVWESWRVAAFTDPQSGHAHGAADLAKVTVAVTWTVTGGGTDSLRLARLFPLP